MRNIIEVECKRIFSLKKMLIFLLIILIYSIGISIKEFNKYRIYNAEGNVEISAKENLNKSKKEKKIILNKDKLMEILERKDKSKYLYNSNLVKLVTLNYDEKKFEELTESDMDNFYEKRRERLKENIENTLYSEKEKDYLNLKIEKLKEPLEIGYAEGWKNLNNDLTDIVLLLIVVISIISLQTFGEDSKTKMKELSIATKNGKRKLIKGRLLAGIILGTSLYTVSIGIFSIIKLFVFGVEGYNLKIQSGLNYFFSLSDITYLEQYFLNVLIGIISLMFMISLAYFFTTTTKKLLSGAVLLSFTWVIMIVMPKGFSYINKYFLDFLPYNITNFRSYYMKNEFYIIFEKVVPNILWIGLILIISLSILFLITIKLNNFKVKNRI